MKSRFIFFGTPDFAARVLEELAMRNYVPSLIVTAPDKPAGRGLKLMPSATKTWAEARGIPIFQPATLKTADVAERLAAERADLFFVAAYGKIIPRVTLGIPPKGALNIHPSLLPRWRGADPIRSAILAGDTDTGITIMQMDDELDHGPIVAQKTIPVGKKTYEELEKELAIEGGAFLADTLPHWIAGEIAPQEQNHANATFTKKITKEDGRLNWKESAETIARKIRALNPWPGTYTFWNQTEKPRRIRILKAHTIESSGKPGIVFRVDSGLGINCRDSALFIEALQLEGKKMIPSAEFTRGYPDIIGSTLN